MSALSDSENALDLKEHSTKKKRVGDEEQIQQDQEHGMDLVPAEDKDDVEDQPPRVSYRNTLVGDEQQDETNFMYESSCDSDTDEEEKGGEMDQDDSARPRLRLSSEKRRSLRQPWKKAIIVKLMGKNIGLALITDLMRKVWKPVGDFEVLKLGQGYFLVKFDYEHDCRRVLTEGPWMFFGHYLMVQRWKSDFQQFMADLPATALWIRLPELPVEYYDDEVLFDIGKLIGKPLRIDRNTSLATKTDYESCALRLIFENLLLLSSP